jgi:hypothetical protein
LPSPSLLWQTAIGQVGQIARSDNKHLSWGMYFNIFLALQPSIPTFSKDYSTQISSLIIFLSTLATPNDAWTMEKKEQIVFHFPPFLFLTSAVAP